MTTAWTGFPGTVRPDLNAGNRICGCGQPASCILYVPRRRGLSNRVPLCARHEQAHVAQTRHRSAAIMRAWYRSPR